MSTKGEEVCLFLDRTMKLAMATGMMTKKRGGGSWWMCEGASRKGMCWSVQVRWQFRQAAS